jgi:hypothetical protein
MFCPECGTENPEGAATCSHCEGSLQLPQVDSPARPSSGLALVSLILGVLGWVVLPVIGSLLAVVFGHASLREITRSGGQLAGRGMAQGGLFLGYAALAVAALSFVLFVVLPVLGCGVCGICGFL